MFMRIDSVQPLKEFQLLVTFSNGEVKKYNVESLFDTWDMFRPLSYTSGLFSQVKVDEGGYGVSWNDTIDISADELFQNGISVG
jgi:hypothetical protein